MTDTPAETADDKTQGAVPISLTPEEKETQRELLVKLQTTLRPWNEAEYIKAATVLRDQDGSGWAFLVGVAKGADPFVPWLPRFVGEVPVHYVPLGTKEFPQ